MQRGEHQEAARAAAGQHAPVALVRQVSFSRHTYAPDTYVSYTYVHYISSSEVFQGRLNDNRAVVQQCELS